jgi:hypothetical protein
MKQYVIPKSDQLNADDLIGTSKTIKITAIRGVDDINQPVILNFEGDNGRPYKPCKSMRRVLIAAWGEDGKAYVGKSMTLYSDPEVIFGGVKVGGIRISHMSHITKPLTIALTANKSQRKPYTVKPLAVVDELSQDPVRDIEELIQKTSTDRQKFLEFFKASEVDDLSADDQLKAISLLKQKLK